MSRIDTLPDGFDKLIGHAQLIVGEVIGGRYKLIESLEQLFPGRRRVLVLGVTHGHSVEHIMAELLPTAERPGEALELLADVASTNAFAPLRVERRLPITVVFYAHVHPGYYEGDSRIGEAAWRLCYTDGGAISPSPVRERLLDEAIRLAEAMHDKNPFGEVPFDGGKTVLGTFVGLQVNNDTWSTGPWTPGSSTAFKVELTS